MEIVTALWAVTKNVKVSKDNSNPVFSKHLFKQFIISGIQTITDSTKLRAGNMLDSSLDFY